jgi:PleD family two-component response regulator
MGVAQRIREEFRVSSAALLKRDKGVTMSAGVASRCSPRPTHADQLVALADSALYKAKDAGRDCTSVCTPQTAKA